MLERRLLAVSRRNPKATSVFTMVNRLCDEEGKAQERKSKKGSSLEQ